MKNNVRHNKRVRKLIVLTFLCAMILGVSTYAWFIGMKTVNVSSFDVKIATTEGLYISMDGKSWAYNLDINNATVPSINTNKIQNVELIPVSTVGKMDSSSSTMIMYEKGSLTANSNIGYRLLASKVHNYIVDTDSTTTVALDENHKVGAENPYVEKTGYVAFDLYVKNVSGEEYYVENNIKNEEAVYLTTNSKVTVKNGGVDEATGIENSVRVAFAQIGRMEDVTENYDKAFKITCLTEIAPAAKDSVTGICRDAYIWEPNDKNHVENAINWYERSTAGREDRETLTAGEYFSTSAVKAAIESNFDVDVYDRQDDAPDYLQDMVYFTDTDKMQKGVNRKAFMTLAPNSITKIRVYVYLEGQDVDNYDFAQLGRQISVNFGFTKERFQESDIDYSGPNTYITPDTTTPVPNINGSEIESGLSNGVTEQYENSASVPEYAYR